MATNLTDSVLDEPLADSPSPPDEPKGMYPHSAGESADMIAERQARISEAQKRQAEDAALVNQLNNEISVLNSLRQANGQAPL